MPRSAAASAAVSAETAETGTTALAHFRRVIAGIYINRGHGSGGKYTRAPGWTSGAAAGNRPSRAALPASTTGNSVTAASLPPGVSTVSAASALRPYPRPP